MIKLPTKDYEKLTEELKLLRNIKDVAEDVAWDHTEDGKCSFNCDMHVLLDEHKKKYSCG